jgi:hypothetical protein
MAGLHRKTVSQKLPLAFGHQVPLTVVKKLNLASGYIEKELLFLGADLGYKFLKKNPPSS